VRHPPRPRFLAFRAGDPLSIVSAVREGEAVKGVLRLRLASERRREIVGNLDLTWPVVQRQPRASRISWRIGR
jgi:hypothetical protein